MHHLVTIACFAVAVICYIFGAETGAALLLLLGGAMELVGWSRIVKRRGPRRPPD